MKNSKLYRKLYFVLCIISFVVFLFNAFIYNYKSYLEYDLNTGKPLLFNLVIALILKFCIVFVIYIMVYSSIKYLLSKNKTNNKRKIDFKKVFSILVCIALVIFVLATLNDPNSNWWITNVDIIDGSIYLLCLSIPLVIMWSLDLIRKKSITFEIKDCALIIMSIMLNVLLPIIYLINNKTLYYKDLQFKIFGDLHSISVWYYYAFAVVPVVLIAIYTIIKIKSVKRKGD